MKLEQGIRLSLLIAAAVSLVVGVLGSMPASAQVVKCKSASGQITYTQATCPPGTTNEDVARSISSETAAARASRVPAPAAPDLAPAPARRTSETAAVPSPATPAPRTVAPARTSPPQPRGMSEEEIRACLTKPLFPFGTEAEIKECSRVRGLPSTSEWAQIDAGVSGGLRSAVVCLTSFPSKNKEGRTDMIRVAIYVNKVEGKYYPVDETKRSFDTLDEAARSGCAYKISSMAQSR